MGRVVDVVLTGQRVQLRPPRPTDDEALFKAVSDPRVTRYLRFQPHQHINDTRRAIIGQLNVGIDHTWAIVRTGTDEAIGTLSYRPSPYPHAMEMGYLLGADWWGRGVMTESIKLALGHLQQDSGVYRVWATCHVDNIGSARALQRAGLELEGRMTRHCVFPNLSDEPYDSFLYARAMR